jgi:hypothetical protein
MIAFLVATLLLAGTGIGWFAHHAFLSVQAWGRAMNEQGAILKSATDDEIDGALHRVRVLSFEESAADPLHAFSTK